MEKKNSKKGILFISVTALFAVLIYAYIAYASYNNGAIYQIYEHTGGNAYMLGERMVIDSPFTTDLDVIIGVKLELDTGGDIQNGFISVSILTETGELLAESHTEDVIYTDRFVFDNPVSGISGDGLTLRVECESYGGSTVLGLSDSELQNGGYVPAFGLITTGNDAFFTLQNVIYIILIIAVISVISIAVLDREHRIGLPAMYIIAGLVMGFIFALIIPLFAVPDEKIHMYTAYDISDTIMGEHGSTLLMRAEDAAKTYNYMNLSRLDYNYEYTGLFSGAESCDVIDSGMAANGSPGYLYIISGLGITLGRLLGCGTSLMWLIGRLFNMLVFVCAVYYSMRRLPFGKGVLFVWALLPITLQQTSSYSYDSPVLALSILTIATALSAIYGCEQDGRKRLANNIVFVISALLLIPCKGHSLAPLVLLPLIIVYRYVRDNRQQIKNRLCGLKLWIKLSGSVFILAAIAAFGVKAAAIIRAGLLPENINSNYIEWAGTNGYTWGFFVKNPIRFIEIMIKTIWNKSDYYIQQMLGGSLGWLQIQIPWFILIGFLILLLYAAMRSEGEPQPISTGERIYILFICAVVSALAIIAMLLYWTPETSGVVEGVQGRYFLPALVPALLVIRTKKTSVSRDKDRYVAVFTMLLQMLVVTAVFKNFI